MSKRSTWRMKRDALFRGDGKTISAPDPTADASIVRHVLYLGGAGRPTPYHSASEERATAQVFAGRAGQVWSTRVGHARSCRAEHVSRLELLRLLKGKGKGNAKWPSAFEVMQARRYVERATEHLISYTQFVDVAAASVAAAKIFT